MRQTVGGASQTHRTSEPSEVHGAVKNVVRLFYVPVRDFVLLIFRTSVNTDYIVVSVGSVSHYYTIINRSCDPRISASRVYSRNSKGF